MADTKETKEIKFKPELEEMASRIQPLLSVDKDSGVITATEDFFASLLPEGQNVEGFVAHQKTMDLITSATKLAGVRVTTEAMKKHKKLEQTSYDINTFGHNTLSGVFKRHGTRRDKPGADANIVQYVGAVGHARHDVVSTRTKVEDKNISKLFQQLAEEAGL